MLEWQSIAIAVFHFRTFLRLSLFPGAFTIVMVSICWRSGAKDSVQLRKSLRAERSWVIHLALANQGNVYCSTAFCVNRQRTAPMCFFMLSYLLRAGQGRRYIFHHWSSLSVEYLVLSWPTIVQAVQVSRLCFVGYTA